MAELATMARPYAEALFRVAKAADVNAWSELVSESQYESPKQLRLHNARCSGRSRGWQLFRIRNATRLGLLEIT